MKYFIMVIIMVAIKILVDTLSFDMYGEGGSVFLSSTSTSTSTSTEVNMSESEMILKNFERGSGRYARNAY